MMQMLPDLNGEFCLRLTLTLLHFLWQGVAIALLAAGAGVALRRAGAAARYWVFVAALGTMALCPVVTFRALAPRPSVQRVIPNTVEEPVAPLSPNVLPVSSPTVVPGVPSEIQPVAMGISPASSPVPSPAPSRPLKERLLEVLSSDTYRTAAPWVAGGYFVGVLAMLARLLLALRGGRGLRRQSNPVTEPAIRAMFERAATAVRLGARPGLAWCERVAVPTVVGLLKPTILLPLSLSSGLAPDQIEMLLLHELAHLRRHDHWVNLAQWVVETAMFFHPAVWWVSRRIRAERELACDDRVLAAGVGEASYAESLLRMAELSRLAMTPSDPTVALALGSHGSRFSGFGQRILRLIEGREALESLRPARVWPVVATLVVLLGGCFSVALHRNGKGPDGLSPKPEKIRFSNGVEAELAGVGEVIGKPQPGGNVLYSLPSKRYWSPDGKWMYPEIRDFKDSGSSLVQKSEGQIVRQFCLRLNRPETGDIAARYKIDRKSPTFSGCSGTPLEGTYLLSGTSSLPENPRTVDLELGVAAGPWKTLIETRERGGSGNGQDYSVAISPLSQQGTQWSVTVSHNLDGDKKDCRAVAIDDQGNSHVSNQSNAAAGTGFIQSTFDFLNIPETVRIVRLEFQTRDYEWRTIRNVHLYPDPDATDPDKSKNDQTRKQELQIEMDRVEQQSSDGHCLLVADGDSRLRIEADRFSTENIADGRVRITVNGSEAFPLKVGILLNGGGEEAQKARLAYLYNIAARHPSVQTFYILQQGWDRELVAVPTALVVPQGMKESKDWQKWKKIRDIRNLEYTDELGRKYVLQGLGWDKLGETEFPTIPRLERYRPDGTLEAFSVYMESQPIECFFFGLDGKTMAGYLVMGWKESKTKRSPDFQDFSVRDVTWRDPEGKYHQHATATQGVFPFEWAGNLDENKRFSIEKLINGKNELVNEPFRLDAAKAVGKIKPLIQPGPNIPAPPLKLEVRTYQKRGEPIAVKWSVGAWEWESAEMREVFLRIDGQEFGTECESNLYTRGISSTSHLSEKWPTRAPAGPFWMLPGKHRIVAVLKNVKVRPKQTDFNAPPPAVVATLDEVVSNEVEYEVGSQIPPDYFQKVYQEGWEETLRQKFDGIRYSLDGRLPRRYDVHLDWKEDLPVGLAFDVAIQREGDSTTHSLTSLTQSAGDSADRSIFSSDTINALTPQLINQRVRLVMTPSTEAAATNPSVRSFYGKPFVTDWMRLKPDVIRIEEELRAFGVRTFLIEFSSSELGIIKRKSADGGGVKVIPGRSVRLLPFPGGTLPWDAMRIVGRDPEKLRQSTVQEVPAEPDQIVCVAVLTEGGKTRFILVDASASLDQRFYSWTMGHGLEQIVVRIKSDNGEKRFVAPWRLTWSHQIPFEDAQGRKREIQWEYLGGDFDGENTPAGKYRFTSRVRQANGQWQEVGQKEIEYHDENRVTIFEEGDTWVGLEVQPWTEDGKTTPQTSE